MNRRSFAPQWCWALSIAIVILGLFAVVAAYFWAHKPFDADVVAGLARSLTSIVAWLGINWLSAALGRRVGGQLLLEERPSTRLALSAGIGLGLVSLLVLGLGLVGYLRPGVAWGLVLVLGILLWRDLLAILADLRSVRLPRPATGFQYWLMVYGGVSLLLIFLVALAPPTGWDTLVYHLTGPRLFVEAGRIIHPIDLPYLGFPQLGEMQTTLGLLLVGDGVAPLLHFGYGLLALVITASLAHRAFGKDVAWLAVTLLLSVPTFLSLMTRAYVDATLLFYGTAAAYTLVCWRERRVQGSATSGRGWLMAMGLFCGFCAGIKYTAVLIPVALGLSLIWVSRHDRPITTAGRLALVAVIAVAAALPGLLENWMTTGNPVYPFFFADGVYWDEWRHWWFDRPGTGLATTAPWRLLTAPLEATVLGTEGTVLYDATVGPLVLTSMALLAAVWHSLSQEERAIAGHLLLFFGLNYALWLSGLGRTVMLLQTRLLFPVFGAAAVLGGLALDRLRNLRRPQFDVAWVVRAVMSLTLALLLFSTFTMFLEINPLPVVLGLESPDDYLARRLGWYYVAVQNINRELPPGAVVLFLWEPRSYHCQVECWPDAMLDHFLHTVHLRGQDAADVASYWRMQGVTHVLLHHGGLDLLLKAQFDPITLTDLRVLEDLQSRHMELVEGFGSAYELYRLR